MKFGKLCAIIPVRAGSKRVPDKNTRLFAGSNLLAIKINQLKEIFTAADIIVSTDCAISARIASDRGATVQWRPSEFASDTVSMSEVYKYVAEQAKDYEHILFTHVTSPLCEAIEYREAISAYENIWHCRFDSLTTISYLRDFMYTPDKVPLNFDPKNKPRSQDLPLYFKLNHAISILPRSVMIEQKNIVGQNPQFIPISDLAATDIDTFLDFNVAEYIYNNQHTSHP